jgi:predicted nucleic acid-binding protein
MDAVLVDTSVWINFFKGNPTPASLYLKNIIPQVLVATCPVIVQEVLQGAKTDKDFKNLKALFENMIQLRGDQYELSIEAAILYRKLRNTGITIRKSNDCLIAAYAITNKLHILHEDKDFDFIAKESDLMVRAIT